MKQKTYKIAIFAILLMSIGIYSCNYYVKHDFRQNYANLNEVLHSDTTTFPFFKIHFKNGNVSVLDHWFLNADQDSINGQGKLYDFNRHQIQEGNLAFEVNNIAIIETNQLEAIKSKDNARIVTLSILTGVNIALDIYCLVNPKACFGSCPTFYIDGREYIHSANAEGFSSSISPCLEKQDIDALNYSSSSEEFSITMKNEALETHMVNELAIHAVAKKKNENIYHDKYGVYYTCGSLNKCRTAKADGMNIKSSVSRFDDDEYFSLTDSLELSTTEEIILEFDQLPTEDVGLLINFRQTLLTTFLLYSGLSYMGDEVGNYFAKIETEERAKKMLSNPFKRLGGIKMYVWDNGQWNLFEELYETGPISKNLMIAPLPKLKSKTGKLKIKLKMAKGLWRLDYLGLSAIHAKVQPFISHPDKIEILDGENYSVEEVKFDDDNYLVSFPGNEFKFSFNFPEIEEGSEYELFLSTKGYYLEWIRQSWIKGKNLPKLKKMLLNDPSTWQDLAQEFKTMEHEMETVFWNSKYAKIQ